MRRYEGRKKWKIREGKSTRERAKEERRKKGEKNREDKRRREEGKYEEMSLKIIMKEVHVLNQSSKNDKKWKKKKERQYKYE